ncbi:flavodoxin family protein [Thermospira aquatica]|uniref:NAD(P)H-dependent oxidoreductase n=1 Tax=Thermospira aquatica TaxID=2828656 RepID=A0AAX3BAH6_9SPIR|nr:NAD(P)H-dependent oxidoreductase [Thermospira aquatica]URA09260.1 NAD(P)H-dependent oxidoreductase [Thermospira aquatica]
MRTLVVLYSYDGNTAFIGKAIADAVGADLEILTIVQEKHHKGFMKYVWNGRAALMKEEPELAPLKHNVAEYDLIFLGTPVWAGTWAPAFNTFFNTTNLTGKKVACFYCHAGGAGSIEKRFRKQLIGSSLLGMKGFIEPLWHRNKNEQEEIARQWARTMVEIAQHDQRE